MKRTLKALGFLLATGFTLCVVGVGVLVGAYLYLAPELPDVEVLREVELKEPMRIYSRDGQLIAEFGEERRKPLEYDEIPERLRAAFIAAEDERFYEHPGVDYQGLIRAGINLIRTGERTQGGSTITMQLARNFFLTRDRTYIRKLNEIFLALKIERVLDKEEILTLYLNKIYLGNRAFGVGAAAEVYFGKEVNELDLPEMAIIAGLPRAPSLDNPIRSPDRATTRRAYVLSRMLDNGIIDSEEYAEAAMAPAGARRHGAVVQVEAPWVAEMARREMLNRFGEDAYTGGYRVFTTLDGRRQNLATDALRHNLEEYDRRHGWRGAIGRIADFAERDDSELAAALRDYPLAGRQLPAVIVETGELDAWAVLRDGRRVAVPFESMAWARPHLDENNLGPAPESVDEVVSAGDVVYLRPGDSEGLPGDEDGVWALGQVPQVQGALVALNPNDGAIVSLAGGYEFRISQFNRAVQADRQPGSAFKPFIFSAALSNGMTPATTHNDAPVVMEDEALEGVWRPENYSRRFFGPTRLREALVYSRNLVSIRVLRDTGVRDTVSHISEFGFRDESLPGDLSLALGTGSMTPLELTRGYATFANGGFRVEPYFIDHITDRHNQVIYQARPRVACPECDEELRLNAEGPEQGLVAPTEEGPSLFDDELSPERPPQRAERVLDERNVFLVHDMLQDVVRYGTGRAVSRQLGREDLAGKTGTANEYRDAWFTGYHPELVATSWIGFDGSAPLGRGESGARSALPGWLEYMRGALIGVPEEPQAQPPGLVSVRISSETGQRVSADDPNAIFEIFREENLPERQEEDSDRAGAEDLF